MGLQGLSFRAVTGSLPAGESPHGGGGFAHIVVLPLPHKSTC